MDSLPDIVIAAQNGDQDALQQLRQSLTQDPSIDNPHYMDVYADGMISDDSWTQRLSRRDMFPAISKFYAHSWGVDKESVTSLVSKYASLMNKFTIETYQEIDRIETQLVCDELLPKSEQAKLIAKLARLNSDRAPVWQNLITENAAKNGNLFNKLVNQWLDEPLDWEEQQHFDPVKAKKFYNLEFARVFFKQLPQNILDFLGVVFYKASTKTTGEDIIYANLDIPIPEANRRAKALKVKFKFRKFE